MPPRPVRGRVSHERSLCKLLTEDTGYFATRTGGTSMPWADVHVYRPTDGVWTSCVVVEVKSSVRKKKKNVPREVEQFDRYRRVWDERHVPVYYAFRWVTHEQMPERRKWRFFHVRDMHNVRLDWEKGMTYRKFIEKLRGG